MPLYPAEIASFTELHPPKISTPKSSGIFYPGAGNLRGTKFYSSEVHCDSWRAAITMAVVGRGKPEGGWDNDGQKKTVMGWEPERVERVMRWGSRRPSTMTNFTTICCGTPLAICIYMYNLSLIIV